MKCPKCNAEIPTGSPFCTSCGAATGDASAATVSISLLEIEDPLLKAVREELATDYYVEKEVGRGGMAIVFKGKEIGLERQVALKVLPPEMAMSGGTADRFKREARLAAALDHPNILPIYRVGQAGNFHYMAMKFVEGRAVDSMVHKQGALPIPVVTRILHDAASALAFAHDAGIIHRDVKGGNILVDKNDGRVMMSDFGIARAAGEASLTASGMMVGTPSFMSPEQCGAGAVGPQSDQYSLGILGFHLLTAQMPFEADSLVEIIQHHYMTPPPDLRQVRKEVPEELYQVIYRALEKNPNDRFATTIEMAEALDLVPLTPEQKKDTTAMLKELAQGQKIGEVRTASLPPSKLRTGPLAKLGTSTGITAAPAKSRTGLYLGLVAGVVAITGIGAYVLVNKPPAQAPGQNNSATNIAAPAGPGGLRVAGLPAGAKIFVDGKEFANNGTVPSGTHTWKLTAPGYRSDSASFIANPGEMYALVSPLKPIGGGTPRIADLGTNRVVKPVVPTGVASLRVSADPTAADIFLDGNKIGSGRVILPEIPAGSHRLRVSLSGFATFDTSFSAAANETVTIRPTLKATQ